jgi:2-methylcitrate dehydratase PrpD
MSSSSASQSIGRTAANWASELSWSGIPAEMVEDTKLRILDIIGVMLAGKDMPVVQAVRRATAETGEGRGEFPVVGFPDRTTASAAAVIQGVMSTALEFDDTHLAGPVHSTGPVVSAVLPMASSLHLSGRRLIESVLVGNELTCRLGQVAPGVLHHCGFHATGALGIFGAIYALNRAAGAPPQRIVDAIGIGASLSSSCMASFSDGTSPKSLHVGFNAASAIRATRLAESGLSGPEAVYEGPLGFFRACIQARDYDFDFDALVRSLGNVWQARDIVSKPYPCSYQTHDYLDALLRLMSDHRLTAADMAGIVCIVPDDALHAIVCEPASEKARPRNRWLARVSMQHALAETAVLGRLDKNAFEESKLVDPRINDLAGRVECVKSPSIGQTGRELRVRLRAGGEVARRLGESAPSSARTMPPERILAKFRANAQGVVSADLIDRVIERVLSLDTCGDVATLAEILSPSGPSGD